LIHEKGVEPHILSTMSLDEEARLLAQRRQDDLPEGTKKEELGEVEDMPLQRAADALRGVLLHAREGTGKTPSKEG
ncbi:MAG: hypothetical protein ACKOAL_02240, partial [Chthoniobacterales bacterium]